MHHSVSSTAKVLDLSPYVDNVGASRAAEPDAGQLNVWGNSLSADHLPAPGTEVLVEGVPFRLTGSDGGTVGDVRCAGQLIRVPTGSYDWIYLLACAERRVEDDVALHFSDDAVDFEPLRVSDFWAAPAVFGETRAFASPVMHYRRHVQYGLEGLLWCQRVPVVRRALLSALRLPYNIAVHVFAATLVAARPGGR